MKARAGHLWYFLLLVSLCFRAKSKCPQSCDLALASFYVWEGSNLTIIADLFEKNGPDEIISNNRDKIPNKDSVQSGSRINIPFSCDVCVRDQYLGHVFEYSVVTGDTYEKVASKYSNLTTVQSLTDDNSQYDPNNIPDTGKLNITVNCSCGNSQISKEFGLFITYPIRSEDTLESIALQENNISVDWIRRYNPGANFSKGNLVFIPGKGV